MTVNTYIFVLLPGLSRIHNSSQSVAINLSEIFHNDAILTPFGLSCWVDKQVLVIWIKVHVGFSIWTFVFRLYCRTRKVLHQSKKTLSRLKNDLHVNNSSLDYVVNI